MEITTKSPQKLYNGSFFGPFFTQKSFFSHWKVFDLKSLKQDSIYGSTEYVWRYFNGGGTIMVHIMFCTSYFTIQGKGSKNANLQNLQLPLQKLLM